jgi:CheY-like chemotaxis protein
MLSQDPLIIVVDDDPSICAGLCELLTSEGFNTRGFVGAIATLDALAAGLRPHLILLDVQMPLMDGRDLVDELQRDPELRSIPVVAMTAGNYRVPSGLRLLKKPLDLDEVLRLASRYSGAPRYEPSPVPC